MSKRRGWWSQTRRDLEGAEAARSRAASAVEPDPFDESPTPVDDSNRDSGEIDTGMTERIEADEDLRRLYVRSEHNRQMIADARKDAANRVLAAMGAIPPEARMSKLEKTIRRLRWIIVAIAIPAGSSAILAGKYIANRAAAETRAEIQLERMIEQLKNSETRFEKLEAELRAASEWGAGTGSASTIFAID